eukprot:1362141-Amorphochlora_amoeboformis.AAC.1
MPKLIFNSAATRRNHLTANNTNGCPTQLVRGASVYRANWSPRGPSASNDLIPGIPTAVPILTGCSRHRRIVRATLKSVKAILVCFRSSGISRDSKRLPRAWVQEADQCSSAAMKILVACGCDEALPSDLLAARKYATQSGLPLFETSSKQCINVTETFVATVNSLMKGGKKAISIQYPNFAEAPSSPRVQTLAERLAG